MSYQLIRSLCRRSGFSIQYGWILALWLWGLSSATVGAATGQEVDQNTALELTQAGRILPLSEVVARLQQQEGLQNPQLLEATLRLELPHPVYLLALIDDDHRVQDLCVDASLALPLPLGTCHTCR